MLSDCGGVGVGVDVGIVCVRCSDDGVYSRHRFFRGLLNLSSIHTALSFLTRT